MAWLLNNLPVVLAGAALLVLIIWLWTLDRRLRRLAAGQDGASLETVITNLARQVAMTDRTNEEIKDYLVKMDERLRRSIQHVKIVRFNPLQGDGTGGNQSFAAAWLDEQGHGLVISSLYIREKTNVYAKPVTKFTSPHELSKEEKQVIG